MTNEHDIKIVPSFVLRDMWVDGSISTEKYSAEVDRRATKVADLKATNASLVEENERLRTERDALREALHGLEWACEQLAATRTIKIYDAMIEDGQADALLSLDGRCRAARAALGREGAYTRQNTPCADCERMRALIIRLHAEGTLSEGQAAKATGLHRIDIRAGADELFNSGAVPDTRGQP